MSIRALNGETPKTGEFVTIRSMVRVRTANGSGKGIVYLMDHLRAEKFNGTATIILSGGSIRTIRLEDRQDIQS